MEQKLDYLWSPWRMEYIQSNKTEDGCVFCNAASQEDGLGNLIAYRGRNAFVILNRYPYTSGHLMIVPYAHRSTIENLSEETLSEMMYLCAAALGVLRKVYHPQGFNVGINIGDAGGAGILDHVHMHIVPRWTGDTNFMSALAGTRVLPETLEETFTKICRGWQLK